MQDTQDICSSCSALINQVDECEIKLMALENEVSRLRMTFFRTKHLSPVHSAVAVSCRPEFQLISN